MRQLLSIAALWLLVGCAGSGLDALLRADGPSTPPAQSFESALHIVATVALDDDDPSGVGVVDQLSARYGVEAIAQWPLATIGVRCIVFGVPSDRLDATLTAMNADAMVTSAQRVIEHSLSAPPNEGDQQASFAALQTNLTDLNTAPAHDIATGHGVRVAVIDTGLDIDHPDLAPTIELTKDFVEDGRRASDERHGTAVAGLISARGALRGVAFEARIMGLRGCWQDDGDGRGACNTISLARALNFATSNDADIINLSITGPPDPLLSSLVDAAVDRGVLVVAAANSAGDSGFPGSHPRVISARGPAAGIVGDAVVAPTDNVLSTAPGGRYDFFSGSSVAAAQIAGVAALMREVRPDLSPELARSIFGSTPFSASAGGSPMANACLLVSRAMNGEDETNCEGRLPN